MSFELHPMLSPGVPTIAMQFNRRNFMKGSAYLAASVALADSVSGPTLAANTGKEKGFVNVQKSLLTFFAKNGCREFEASPLVTEDHGFNGGLRYDDTGSVDQPGHMVIQSCARTTDLSERHRPDILPMFHIFRCNAHANQGRDELFALSFKYLTETLRLDPARLAIVSIPPLEQMKVTIVNLGIDWDRKVHLRDPDAAWKAGDGSGFFRHPGPDYAPALPTAGIYYRLDAEPGDPPKTHPLPATWTEIGEFVITADTVNAFIGLGVERLQLASTGSMPSWEEQLPKLQSRIRTDAGGGALPPGAKDFAAG